MRIGITFHPTYGGSGAVATELGLKLACADLFLLPSDSESFGPAAVEEMADAALELLLDAERWKTASSRARGIALERFRAGEIVPRYETLYTRVLEQDAAE